MTLVLQFLDSHSHVSQLTLSWETWLSSIQIKAWIQSASILGPQATTSPLLPFLRNRSMLLGAWRTSALVQDVHGSRIDSYHPVQSRSRQTSYFLIVGSCMITNSHFNQHSSSPRCRWSTIICQSSFLLTSPDKHLLDHEKCYLLTGGAFPLPGIRLHQTPSCNSTVSLYHLP